MIKLTRTTESPAGFAGEQRIEKNLALIRLRQDGGKADSGVWRRAKAHLKEETRGKCAYCESTTSTVAYGDVEHFRPKSVYWWLAYCYDNSPRGKQARLMTPDPRDRATGGMPFDEFLRAARKEKPYLVDPYVEDPEETPRRSGDRSEGSGRCPDPSHDGTGP